MNKYSELTKKAAQHYAGLCKAAGLEFVNRKWLENLGNQIREEDKKIKADPTMTKAQATNKGIDFGHNVASKLHDALMARTMLPEVAGTAVGAIGGGVGGWHAAKAMGASPAAKATTALLSAGLLGYGGNRLGKYVGDKLLMQSIADPVKATPGILKQLNI